MFKRFIILMIVLLMLVGPASAQAQYPPTNLRTIELTDTKATLTWDHAANGAGVNRYELRLWIGSTLVRTCVTGPASPYCFMSSLQPNTTYRARVAAVYVNNVTNVHTYWWSSMIEFTTLPTPTPTPTPTATPTLAIEPTSPPGSEPMPTPITEDW
jgi:hypothetical protein